MRDIALLCIVLAFCWLALLKPWLGVLGLAVLSYLQIGRASCRERVCQYV